MQQVTEMLTTLAEKFGTSVEYLWPKMVAWEQLRATIWAIGVPSVFIVGLLGFIISMIHAHKADWEDGPWVGCTVFFGILTFFSTIVLLAEWPSQLATAFYPEPAVIKELLGK